MIYMVAVIEDNMDSIIGMRLIDIKYKQLVDAPLDGVIKGIINGTKIENIKIENGQIIGSNGGIDRYTRINSDGQVKGGKTPLNHYSEPSTAVVSTAIVTGFSVTSPYNSPSQIL